MFLSISIFFLEDSAGGQFRNIFKLLGKFFNGLVVLTMEIQCKKEYQVRFSIITVRRVAIIFSELEVVKNFMQKF